MIRPALAAVLAILAIGAAPPFPAPPPEAAPPHGQATAVLAGGCFWGVAGVFEHVRGVKLVTAGYAGGNAGSATYDQVSSEATNHAEAVRVDYDPAQVSYGTLLQVYFAVAHDPTQVDRQYPDSGRSYRSAIFPQTPAQRAEATAYIALLDQAHAFARPIATRLETGRFFPAEPMHQHFLARHPDNPYIKAYDAPKLVVLRQRFPDLWKD
jgi:peptide-methionine (S)-S-oxide reductase